jgi:hypothetical protein
MAMEPPGFYVHPHSERTPPNRPHNIATYLAQRDDWECQLFPFFRACQPSDALKEYLEDPSGTRLYIAHDGGATDRGSFGWWLATRTAILWEGSGHTQGFDPGSFWAESYGMLAALHFLLHYIRFYNVRPAQPNLVHHEYTDSQSLLDRLQSSKERFYASPKACLVSDYVLEAAITATLTDLPLKIFKHHVNSHQDKDEPDLLKLPWKAQLNIICDHLAS